MVKRLSLVIGLVLAMMTAMPVAQATNTELRESWRWEQCRFRSLVGSPDRFSYREMVLTARCVEGRWSVPGGFPMLDRVIDCESGWGPEATSPSGQHRGLMQLSDGIFYTHLGPQHWHPVPNPFNARSNLLAGVRAAHRVGWGPWTCA